jgi:hypothetical protein
MQLHVYCMHAEATLVRLPDYVSFQTLVRHKQLRSEFVFLYRLWLESVVVVVPSNTTLLLAT